jgi:hypothetical protein
MKTKTIISTILFAGILFAKTQTSYFCINMIEASNSFVSFDKPLCQMLSKEEMQTLTGKTFNEVTETVHSVSSGKYVSQCSYYTGKGVEHIAVLLSYIKNYSYPTTIDKYLESSRTGDPELDQDIDDAIKSSVKLEGLGDAAYWYTFFDNPALVVTVEKNYQILITSYGFEFNNDSLDKFKKVAQKVMMLIKK